MKCCENGYFSLRCFRHCLLIRLFVCTQWDYINRELNYQSKAIKTHLNRFEDFELVTISLETNSLLYAFNLLIYLQASLSHLCYTLLNHLALKLTNIYVLLHKQTKSDPNWGSFIVLKKQLGLQFLIIHFIQVGTGIFR